MPSTEDLIYTLRVKHQGEATAFNLTRLGFVPLVVADAPAKAVRVVAPADRRRQTDRDRAADSRSRGGRARAALLRSVAVVRRSDERRKGLIPRPAVPLHAGSVFWKRFATANFSRSTMRTAIDRVKPFQLALIRDLRFAGTSEAEPVEERVSFKVTGYSGLNSVPVHAITAGVRLGSTDAHRCEPML